MINVKRKEDCVGCEACSQKCPIKCIDMYVDEQGFMYAEADSEKCINCGLCDDVCPVINQSEYRKPKITYAAWNDDDNERLNSSSGGIFILLAKNIIENDGIVFGARFDSRWQVVHDYADNYEALRQFQGSKYLQSRIGDSYNQAELFLKQGRKVMFTGTPCQVAGLRKFLRKDWGDSLILVDIVCHGVPSPLVWGKYLESLANNRVESIGNIQFRNKAQGWQNYNISIEQYGESQYILNEPGYENSFIWGFLKDLYLRPSCYECPAKCGKSLSDLTIADFWGIEQINPEIFSEKGVSLVLANSKKGKEVLLSTSVKTVEILYEDALRFNPSIEQSSNLPPQSKKFWKLFKKKGIKAIQIVRDSYKPSLLRRIASKIKCVILKIVKP